MRTIPLLIASLGLAFASPLTAQTWTAATTAFTPGNTYAPSVAFGNGTFVALGLKDVGSAPSISVYTSTDGAVWTERVIALQGASLIGLGKVAFLNNRFVVFGSCWIGGFPNGYTATSTDGTNWTAQTGTNAITAFTMTGGDGVYVATAGTSMRISTDFGATWLAADAPGGGTYNAGWGDIAYSSGRWLMTGEGFSPKWWTSTDGKTWTQTTVAGSSGGRIEAGNGVFVRYVGTYATSTDGVTFTTHTPAPIDNVTRNLIFVAGRFVIDQLSFNAQLGSTVSFVASTDGVTYSAFGKAPTRFGLTAGAEGNGVVVLVGTDEGLNFTTRKPVVLYSTDVPAAPTSSTPQPQTVALGGSATLTTSAAGTLQWQRNGSALSGATSASLALSNVQPADAGIYTVHATSGATVTAQHAIVGLSTTSKVIGAGTELDANIVHPNGNIFDQVLLTGPAEAITADHAQNQITRTSFIDLDDDIVQVEFSGPGTLSLVLDNPTGPAAPTNYNQAVNYMKGHAGIVITGATEHTNVSVFSVGKATAVNQALFKDSVTYDGIADIAFIAIASSNGKFGGVRTANAHYFAAKGLTGLYAPGVAFQGPVYLGDITAASTATPVLIIGSASDTRITGGNLDQDNDAAVEVDGLTQLKFTAGGDSHGNPLPAQTNAGVLKDNGVDVTTQIVVNP